MNPKDFWKNFSFNAELHCAANFVYSGLNMLDSMDNIEHEDEVFEVLYNLSVGIERLLKTAFVLLEHKEEEDQSNFEKRIKSFLHNHGKIVKALEQSADLDVQEQERDFLLLLTEFYGKYRYGRYTLDSVQDLNAEVRILKDFLVKYACIDFGCDQIPVIQYEMEPVRLVIGESVGKLCKTLYTVIHNRAREIGLFTSELRTDSKAFKLFLGGSFDFTMENVALKELIIYLAKTGSLGDIDKLLEGVEPLEFDSADIPNLIESLRSFEMRSTLVQQVKYFYEDIDDIAMRFDLMSYVGKGANRISFDEAVEE